MNIEGRLRNRVDVIAVGKILQAIAVMPNGTDRPVTGDLSGNFDFWFDGGAGRMITGWTIEFADGPCTSRCGSRVHRDSIQERLWGRYIPTRPGVRYWRLLSKKMSSNKAI